MESLIKEKTLLLTNKKFESCDDEILLKEIFPKKPPKLSKEEQDEIEKTIMFSNTRFIDAFNFAKSIWSIAFDNVLISIKKNKENLSNGSGIVIYHTDKDDVVIWEFDVYKPKQMDNAKLTVKEIFKGSSKETSLLSLLIEKSRWKDEESVKQIPIFEAKSSQEFPMEETFIPIMKRKLLAYLYQIAIQK